MKKFLIILFFMPLMLSAQLDFESYKGKLNFVELTALPTLFEGPAMLQKSVSKGNLFSAFRLNSQNFREPVSMMDAMMAEDQGPKSTLEINIDPRSYGVFAGNSSYAPDGATKTKNLAYKEAARGFYAGDTCPPFGICPRCAPYKLNRRY